MMTVPVAEKTIARGVRMSDRQGGAGPRAVLITGASAGIGAALAMEFARRGCALALAARRGDRLAAMEPALRAAGSPQVLCLQLDVGDTDAIAPAVRSAAERLGRLDVVIANAGVAHVTPAGRDKLAQVRETLGVNLVGAIATLEAALPILRAQGGGQLVGITSVAGARGLPGFGAYSASKAGLHRYLQSVRAELRGSGIVVTELAPGYIDTDINRGFGSRPFVIPVERGGAMMAEMIERRVRHRWVPVWPWTLLVLLMRVLPDAMLGPRRNTR
jgi:NAD(P)-dependent dehydrogenase (short-subunit alcohol dehydrogenase family)